MIENQEVLKERLQKLLTRKKSKRYYAKHLGVTEDQITLLMERIRRGDNALHMVPEMANYIVDLEDTIVKFDEDIKAGKGELTARVKDEIKTLDELIAKCNIDTEKWTIDRYVQNYWGNSSHPHWQIKAFLSIKTAEVNFHKEFKDFLKDYRPRLHTLPEPEPYNYISPKSCLIINKQDEHLNKFDILGKNTIQDRFANCYNRIKEILVEASNTNFIENIVYVLGSDQFNSEWTGLTTKGTPQRNILSYHDAFDMICQYELEMIHLLRSYSDNIRIIYVAGNHDEFVGWHLIHWLDAMYSGDKGISFDISPRYRKYITYGKSAIMFNHGDAIKPDKLVNMFPHEYREEWSKCDNSYVFTGDKHHEISKEYIGTMFYQLPALSSAKSSWDDKMGHTCAKAELTAFLLDREDGISTIYKKKL